MKLLTRRKMHDVDYLKDEVDLNARKRKMYRLAQELQERARELEVRAAELKEEIENNG